MVEKLAKFSPIIPLIYFIMILSGNREIYSREIIEKSIFVKSNNLGHVFSFIGVLNWNIGLLGIFFSRNKPLEFVYWMNFITNWFLYPPYCTFGSYYCFENYFNDQYSCYKNSYFHGEIIILWFFFYLSLICNLGSTVLLIMGGF